MIAIPTTETIPIRKDQDGVIRVGRTRVPLETVIYTFNQGATPETIVDRYSALSLIDVYLVIGYYLLHQEEVDEYIRQQEARSEQVRAEVEARHPQVGIRARLLARLEEKRKADAALRR